MEPTDGSRFGSGSPRPHRPPPSTPRPPGPHALSVASAPPLAPPRPSARSGSLTPSRQRARSVLRSSTPRPLMARGRLPARPRGPQGHRPLPLVARPRSFSPSPARGAPLSALLRSSLAIGAPQRTSAWQGVFAATIPTCRRKARRVADLVARLLPPRRPSGQLVDAPGRSAAVAGAAARSPGATEDYLVGDAADAVGAAVEVVAGTAGGTQHSRHDAPPPQWKRPDPVAQWGGTVRPARSQRRRLRPSLLSPRI